MAANIQFIFYKNSKKPDADVLVKALLNEEEVTMPLPKTSTPYYYKWKDFKTFYLKLLNSYKSQTTDRHLSANKNKIIRGCPKRFLEHPPTQTSAQLNKLITNYSLINWHIS